MKMPKMQRTNLRIGWSSRLGGKELELLAGPPTGLPDFGRWMAKWCRDREEFWAAHPAMVELANHLAAHRPAGKNPWDTTHFEVAIAGSQYQVRVLRRGRQPVEEAAAIEPLLRGIARRTVARPKQSRALVFNVFRDVGRWPHPAELRLRNAADDRRNPGRPCRGERRPSPRAPALALGAGLADFGLSDHSNPYWLNSSAMSALIALAAAMSPSAAASPFLRSARPRP